MAQLVQGTLLKITDLGSPIRRCDNPGCGAWIQYQYDMQLSSGEVLGVGGTCAGVVDSMAGVSRKKLQDAMTRLGLHVVDGDKIKRTVGLAAFLDKGWKESRNGNQTRYSDHTRITEKRDIETGLIHCIIYPLQQSDNWNIVTAPKNNQDDARTDAFDVLEHLDDADYQHREKKDRTVQSHITVARKVSAIGLDIAELPHRLPQYKKYNEGTYRWYGVGTSFPQASVTVFGRMGVWKIRVANGKYILWMEGFDTPGLAAEALSV